MAMNKANIKKIVVGGIVIIVIMALGYGIHAFVQRLNGTSPAQIEAQRRAKEAAEQTEKALYEQSQWHRDLMSEPVTVTNSEGESVTYETKTATCVQSAPSSN